MTIAACYVSGEGVVFGADSTTTVLVAGRGEGADRSEHHLANAQKLFEIGEESTLGIVTWGMGNLGDVSQRTLIALFADDLNHRPAASMQEVAERWSVFFRNAYTRAMQAELQLVGHLLGLTQPTDAERTQLIDLKEGLSGGFCVGGYLVHDRRPGAFVIEYDPTLSGPWATVEVEAGTPRFWGTSNLLERLLVGVDLAFFNAILRSPLWTGTSADLTELLRPFALGLPKQLPIREAIDWIHSAIETTIKAIKFSHYPPTCGGPIELAVITTDRLFRWVRHKQFGSAIGTGEHSDV